MTNKIDLSSIFDVYSMREQPAAYSIKALTQEFKNRVLLFCQEMVPPYDHYSEAGHKIADYWMTCETSFGTATLSSISQTGIGITLSQK